MLTQITRESAHWEITCGEANPMLKRDRPEAATRVSSTGGVWIGTVARFALAPVEWFQLKFAPSSGPRFAGYKTTLSMPTYTMGSTMGSKC